MANPLHKTKKDPHHFYVMSKRSYSASGTSTSSYAARKTQKVSRFPRVLPKTKKRAKYYPTLASQREIARLIDRKILAKKEIKYSLETLSTTVINAVSGTTAAVSLPCAFNNIDQGTDINDRISNTIELVKARVTFDLDAGLTNEDDTILVYAVKSLAEPGIVPTVATYSDHKYTSVGLQQGIQSSSGFANAQLPWNNREYRVVYEERFLISSSYKEEGSTAHCSRTVDLTRFYRKMQTYGLSTTDAMERITLYFVPLATLSANTLTVQATFTAEFVDA